MSLNVSNFINLIYLFHWELRNLIIASIIQFNIYFGKKLNILAYFKMGLESDSCIISVRLDWNKIKIISLFSLFLLLFVGLTVLFDTIHEPHCTISTNFYLYL